MNHRKIRHVGVFSAMKVGCVLNVVVWVILGLLFVAAIFIFASSVQNTFPNNALPGPFSNTSNTLTSALVTYVTLVIGSGLAGAIIGAVYAFLYNVTSALTGGLEVDVE